MLEKLLKELGEKGYEISWRYEFLTNSIVLQIEKREEGYLPVRYGRQITFDQMRAISGGQPGFEFAMTQILRWSINKIEEELGGENGGE